MRKRTDCAGGVFPVFPVFRPVWYVLLPSLSVCNSSLRNVRDVGSCMRLLYLLRRCRLRVLRAPRVLNLYYPSPVLSSPFLCILYSGLYKKVIISNGRSCNEGAQEGTIHECQSQRLASPIRPRPVNNNSRTVRLANRTPYRQSPRRVLLASINKLWVQVSFDRVPQLLEGSVTPKSRLAKLRGPAICRRGQVHGKICI